MFVSLKRVKQIFQSCQPIRLNLNNLDICFFSYVFGAPIHTSKIVFFGPHKQINKVQSAKILLLPLKCEIIFVTL